MVDSMARQSRAGGMAAGDRVTDNGPVEAAE
jgi:hypothetical protein